MPHSIPHILQCINNNVGSTMLAKHLHFASQNMVINLMQVDQGVQGALPYSTDLQFIWCISLHCQKFNFHYKKLKFIIYIFLF